MTLAELKQEELPKTTNCPACHAPSAFRPRGVMGQFWFNRCTNCGYDKHWRLPRITKKIIYLDQLVISNMVKAKQPFWTELQKKLATLTGLQLVVCPYSEIHQDESLLSHDLRDELKAMYRSFGGNDKFRDVQEIEQRQLLRSIRRYLGVSDPDGARPAWQDAFERDPHSWAVDPNVFADFPVHEPWVTDLRNRKQALHSDLESVANNWKDEEHSFRQDVKREGLSYGRTLLKLYREMAGSQQRFEANLTDEMRTLYRLCAGPDRFDPPTPPGLQPGVMLIHWLAAEAHHAPPDTPDPVAVVEQFFESDEALNTPFLYISNRLWAAIAQKVRSPKGSRQPKPSDHYDVRSIATYAPYCDAMFVDKEFREMASQKNVDVPGRFGARLFSMKTRDQFVAYLDDTLHDISDAHREGLVLAYPYLKPLLTARNLATPCARSEHETLPLSAANTANSPKREHQNAKTPN